MSRRDTPAAVLPNNGVGAWGRDDLMAISAVRYCIGRMTYITSDCGEWLLQQWPNIRPSAREWFEKNGFTTIRHDKSGGAANSGPSMSTTMNAAIGKGRGVMPLIGERIRKRRDDNEAEKT